MSESIIMCSEGFKGMLYRHLRCQCRRKKRYGTLSHRDQFKETASIEARPDTLSAKWCIGD